MERLDSRSLGIFLPENETDSAHGKVFQPRKAVVSLARLLLNCHHLHNVELSFAKEMFALHLQRPILLSPARDHHPLPLLHIGHLSVDLHEGAVQLLAILTRELKLLQLAVGFGPANNLNLRC